jgi:hypothetical protein
LDAVHNILKTVPTNWAEYEKACDTNITCFEPEVKQNNITLNPEP